MATSSILVLVADDFEPVRRFLSSTLQDKLGLPVIFEASDGFEAVRMAQDLQPDLILLDIGLPSLNGIEAAQRIQTLSPKSKILFVSQESSADIVQEALNIGASGYVLKADAGRELPVAVTAVLRGERFVSARFAGLVAVPQQPRMETTRHHDVGFYSEDRYLLDDLTLFVGTALKAGNPAIVIATEPHRDGLLPRLQAHGVDLGAAIEQGRYIAFDAAETLATFMVDGMPDPERFSKLVGSLVVTAAQAAKREQSRVAIYGECVDLLWAQGNTEAAIQIEKLANQLTQTYDLDILCGYSPASVPGGMDDHTFQRICAEHSAVCSR